MPTQLFLIRHCMTDYTKQQRYCGWRDPALSSDGRDQAKLLKNNLDGEQFDALYCSPLRRTSETAEMVFPGEKIIFDDRLKELNFGSFEGLTHQEAMAKYPDLYNQWLHSPYSCQPPAGESVENLFSRVVGFLEQIVRQHDGKRIMVLTHGGPIKVMTGYLMKMDPEDIWGIMVDSASISMFVLEGDRLVEHFLNKKYE
jgi:broad specificity phosphatase PhoE